MWTGLSGLRWDRGKMAATCETEHVAHPTVINGRKMIILYGSETGNGEEIAGELGKMAERLHFQTVVDEMDSFKLVGRVTSVPLLLLPRPKSNDAFASSDG